MPTPITCLPLLLALSACGGTFLADDLPDGGQPVTEDRDALPGAPPTCGPSPWITLRGVPNTRSLGGIPLSNGARVGCGLLYRGSYLSGLTEQGCQDFAALNIKTVIDLREPSERIMPPACVSTHASIWLAPMPIPYNVSPADYLADLYATSAIAPAMAALSNPDAYPIYFHCVYGRDRSGVLAAVVLLALGASPDEIRREYLLTQQSGYGAYPASLDAVLDEIARIGGIDAYFAVMGIPAEQVSAMRAVLVDGIQD